MFLQDTWAWNGATWRQLAPATQPPAAPMSLALHEVEGRPWLFSTSSPGTWRWTGADWQSLGATIPPGFAVVFDRQRGQFLRPDFEVPRTSPRYFGPHVLARATARGFSCGAVIRFVASTPHLGNPSLRFEAQFALPASPALLALGSQTAGTPFGTGCTLLVGGQLNVYPFTTNAAGCGSVALPVPLTQGLLGLQFFSQAFALDTATGTISATHAEDLLVGN